MLQLIKWLCSGLFLTTIISPIPALAVNEPLLSEAQAALQACIDQEEGAICSFTNSVGESINGVCGNNPAGQLTCIPYQVD